MTAEAGLRSRVLHAVRQQWPRSAGVLLRGNPASAATGPGHPDIDGVVRSRPIALELKKARGKPTPLQILRLQDLRDAGGYAWIVRSPYEACEAVYWVAKGWTRPLSNEPLDLNAWLTGDPPKVEAVPFEPKAQEAPELLGTTPMPEAPLDYKTPVEAWDTPEHQDTAARVLGFEDAEQRRQVEATAREKAAQPIVDEELGEQQNASWLDKGPFAGMSGEDARMLAITDALDKLNGDVRTVGDRVTILWERQGEYLAVLQDLHHKVSVILGMIEEDPGVDLDANGVDIEAPTVLPAVPPKRTRTRKPKAFEVTEPQPEPVPDIAF